MPKENNADNLILNLRGLGGRESCQAGRQKHTCAAVIISKRLICAGLIALINWQALLAVADTGWIKLLEARAYFYDTENHPHSALAVSSLDLGLPPAGDFEPEATDVQDAEREIAAANQGALDFKYRINLSLSMPGQALCQALWLAVERNGLLIYSGDLANFNAINLPLAAGNTDTFSLRAGLSDFHPSLMNQACEFDLVFDAEQYPESGFSDLEIISNIVNSGSWDWQAGHLLINKAYYDVDSEYGLDGKNEWIELLNPTDSDINLKDWEICNQEKCAVINPNVDIPAHGYALVSHDHSTWNFWDIPDDIVLINSLGGQAFNMDNTAEMLLLKHPDGTIIDQLNWGDADIMGWPNFNGDVWRPEGIHTAPGDRMAGRVPSGYDTDAVSDWKVLKAPVVDLTYPEGGEVWYVGHTYEITWTATNMNGPDSALAMDIFYSHDSGHTWAQFAASTTNDGLYEWTVPLFIDGYFVPSSRARIRVKARGPENFMVYAEDESEDFCPPIDLSLITPEEIETLIQLGIIDENYDPNGIIDPEDIFNMGSTTDEQANDTESGQEPDSSAASQSDIGADSGQADSAASDTSENTANASTTDETASTTPESNGEETASTTEEAAAADNTGSDDGQDSGAAAASNENENSEPDNALNSSQTGGTVAIGTTMGLNIDKMFDDYSGSSEDGQSSDTDDPDTALREPDPAIDPVDTPGDEGDGDVTNGE